ncbi:ATP-binding protein [Deinococcus yavapaiensis]|uniref:ATP-binding protein n=1 Tax=Deinococcus yavapaiensis TaxID=309889 RepID=UPI001474BC50|nr:BTAD domain-containing putative transcriptional regulator [Deinococcus yavapaiensis]
MNLFVLGPPVVQAHPPIHVTSRKALALLIILALDGPRSREELAHLLWPRSRSLALQSLRASLIKLRGALGEHAHLLHVDREHVALQGTYFEVDAHQLDAADEHELLTLWRGPFLHGLRVHDSVEWDDWVNDWNARLLSRFRSRVEELTRHLLRQERFEDAIRLARHNVDLDPLSEPNMALLLNVLVHVGRVNDAQQAAVAFTERFTQELSVPPTLPPLPELPSPTFSARTRSNLEFERTNFIGRDAERATVRAALQHARLVTLHGPGGLGKTRLARTVGHVLADEGSFEFVAFVPVETLQSAVDLPVRMAAALGRTVMSVDNGLEELASVIGHAHVLLILDNFEHLTSEAWIIDDLLGRCPHVRVLVTSRERLSLKAETVVPLLSLAVPNEFTPLDVVQQADAVRLFVDRAKSARFDFTPSEESWTLVRRACELVEGLPLGIELAAAWTSTWPLAFIVQELERDPLSLSHPLRDAPSRHGSLRTSFDVSWRFLQEEERRVLARLSVFHGGFSLEAARQVAEATPEVLAQLTSKALVNFDGAQRYAFHPLVREYARAHLDEQLEERDVVLAAHASYFLGALRNERMSIGGAASPELLTFVRTEEANLLALLTYLQEARQYAALAALAEPLLWHFPASTGPNGFTFALRLAQRLLDALPEDEADAKSARLAVMSSYAWLLLFVGSLKASVCMYEDAVRLARTLGNDEALQRALDGLGQALYRSGRSEEAAVALEDAVRLAQRQEDPYRLFRALNNLMMAAGMSDDFERAASAASHAEALRTNDDVADGMDVVWFLTNEGAVHLLQGRYESALSLWQEGLDVAADTGMTGQRTIMHALRAWAFLERGLRFERAQDLSDAADAAREAEVVARHTGEPFALNLTIMVLARLQLHAGDADGALQNMREALLGCWRSENIMLLVWLLPYLAEALDARGDATAVDLATFLSKSPLAKQHVKERTRTVLERTYRHVNSSKEQRDTSIMTLEEIVTHCLA